MREHTIYQGDLATAPPSVVDIHECRKKSASDKAKCEEDKSLVSSRTYSVCELQAEET